MEINLPISPLYNPVLVIPYMGNFKGLILYFTDIIPMECVLVKENLWVKIFMDSQVSMKPAKYMSLKDYCVYWCAVVERLN